MRALYQITFLAGILISCGCSDSNPSPSDDDNVPPPPSGTSSFTITTLELSNDLTIDIYVPRVENASGKYPIIYFNDGDVFKGAIASLTSYQFEPGGAIEPFIMVGISAAGHRYSRYIPYNDQWIKENWSEYSPGSINYTERLINEVIPKVEEDYPVDTKRRAIFGFSLSGLYAAWAGINYPEVFSFSASMSPSFWVADYAIFDEPRELSNTRFYFDIGTKEWNYYVPMIESLENRGFEYGKDIFYYEVPNGIHVESDWASRLHIPLGLFLNGAPEEVKDYEVIKECIPSQSTAGLVFQRLNPIVTFTNGIRYSLSTSATFQVVSGDGVVLEDGRFDAKGGSMTVEVSHGNWSEHISLNNCNN
jgi:predicted alpha/beta superfamily hydrolase